MKLIDAQPLAAHPQHRSPEPSQLQDRPLPNQKYWLCEHIYLCATHSGVVFLDTRRDRYFGLCGIQLRALSLLVEGWPEQPHLIDATEHLSLQDAVNIANRYVQAGLLTLDRAMGKAASAVSLNLGRDLVAIGADVQRQRPMRLHDIVCFFLAYAEAAYALRVHSLETVVLRARQRKRKALGSGASFSSETAAELVCIFRRLRSFTILGKDRCLFQALALVRFLSRYGQFPAWVFGVRTEPWAAHSWVQEGNYVLDSTPEAIRFYTPILMI